MADHDNDIDALLLRFHPEHIMGVFIDDVSCARYRAALTALVAERDSLRAELLAESANTASLLRTIALIREAGGLTRDALDALPDAVKAIRQQRDEALDALKQIATYDYRGNSSGESRIARHALAAMRKGATDEK